MKTWKSNVLVFGLVAIVLIFAYFKPFQSDIGENYQHRYDSISSLQELSIRKEVILQSTIDSLEGLKMARLDSADRKDQYDLNQKEYEEIGNIVYTVSISEYERYITERTEKISEGIYYR